MSQPVPFPPPPWRQQLLALPEVEPPPALWARLAAARRAAARRRRQPLWLGLAAASGLIAVLGFVLLGRDAAPGAGTAAVPAPAAAVPAADPGLQRLDDQIAMAYARGAADEELAVLWQTRAQLIESLQGPAPAVLARL
jgi:hypothetical protein